MLVVVLLRIPMAENSAVCSDPRLTWLLDCTRHLVYFSSRITEFCSCVTREYYDHWEEELRINNLTDLTVTVMMDLINIKYYARTELSMWNRRHSSFGETEIMFLCGNIASSISTWFQIPFKSCGWLKLLHLSVSFNQTLSLTSTGDVHLCKILSAFIHTILLAL